MKAVISADLIDSTKYEPKVLAIILNTLSEEFTYYEKEINAVFRIFKGDSFQGVIYHPEKALETALSIKTVVNKLAVKPKNSSALADFRMAIGIGDIDLERESILESNGTAFQYSGRTLDSMKGEIYRLRIQTPNEEYNDEFNTHFTLLESIMNRWSRASAEVVYYLLKGKKEVEIADIVGINQSAVNHRKKAANWDAISRLLARYRTATTELINQKS